MVGTKPLTVLKNTLDHPHYMSQITFNKSESFKRACSVRGEGEYETACIYYFVLTQNWIKMEIKNSFRLMVQ